MIGAMFVLICVLKLVKTGRTLQEFTYPGIVEKAIGPRSKLVIEIFLAIC